MRRRQSRRRRCPHRRGGLRGRLFAWFVFAIIATAGAAGLVFKISNADRWRAEIERVERFLAARFAAVWNDPAAREELVSSAEREFDVHLTLVGENGEVVYATAGTCRGRTHVVPVPDHGTVTACVPNPHDHGTKVALSLVVAALVLMLLSGVLARRLARPIRRVASVATAIGTGDLSARVTRVRRIGEVGVLADAIDDMAERIETQVRDQKELMAGVSHELRTPLGHVRLLLELARSGDTDALDELEREVEEMDRLVGELLARSRLDFASLDHRSLDPVDLARRALERQGIDVAKLVVDEPIDELVGDPTLLGRALANILSNAERHGGGLITLRVSQDDELVFFVAEDAGPGFQEDAFDPFVRTPSRGRHPSLGLGLVLTRRIAEAHGGNVTVAGNAPRGARVQLAVERHSDLES